MAKFKTYDEAVTALEAAKEELKTLKEEKRSYLAENGIKKGKVPDEKQTKKIEKMDAAIDAKNEEISNIRDAAKELKPRKERQVKYEYPEGMTNEEKKKFRAKARREAKNADKPVKEPKAKKSEGEEKPAKKVVKKVKNEEEEED